MVAQKISRRTILRLLPKLQRGTHVDQSAVKMSRARRVVLESDEAFLVEADGEMPYGSIQRLEIDVLPGRLRLLV
jgi:diacylglycerol kinase family enzyme